MAIVKLSIDNTVERVNLYKCLVTDPVSSYPTDCDADSRMIVLNGSGVKVADLIFNGTKWVYINQKTVLEDTYEFEFVTANDDNKFALDVKSKGSKNFAVEVPFDIAQVETATVVGTITGDGDATVIVTGAGITGSPITLNVAVLTGDTASIVAGKIRTAIGANTAITAKYAVSGTGATVVLTKLIPADNDSTLNIDINNGTCSGLTDTPSSANTTAGDVNAKTFTISNVATVCKITLLLKMLSDASLTMFNGVTWSGGSAPTFTLNHVYKIEFLTVNGGTNFYASVVDCYTS